MLAYDIRYENLGRIRLITDPSRDINGYAKYSGFTSSGCLFVL